MSLAFQTSLFDDIMSEPELRPLGAMVQRIDLADGAWLDLRPGWLSNSDALFESLAVGVPWQAEKREMFEKVVVVPRLVAHFGAREPLPHPVLAEAQDALNDHYGRPAGQVFETAGLCF